MSCADEKTWYDTTVEDVDKEMGVVKVWYPLDNTQWVHEWNENRYCIRGTGTQSITAVETARTTQEE